ncbi:MAG TPA: methionyl-tRNA formyltransferase [Acidimicrobiia bacterium]
MTGNDRGRIHAVFLGTPESALPALESLHRVADIAAVLTRPDRPQKRSGSPQPSPVKQRALALGLPVAQPGTAAEVATQMMAIGDLDIAVVVAYGLLIPPAALQTPRRGFVNIHFSLLPRWRGASPVAAAIAAGDEETGVSLMVLDQGLDTGPVLAAKTMIIGRDENAGSLTTRLATIGAQLVLEMVPGFVRGEIEPVAQVGEATYSRRLRTVDAFLDLQEPAETLARKVRAWSPRPGASLFLEGRRVRVAAARAVARPLATGQVLVENDRLVVGAGGSGLELLRVQPAGRTEMAAADWLRGLRSIPTTAS